MAQFGQDGAQDGTAQRGSTTATITRSLARPEGARGGGPSRNAVGNQQGAVEDAERGRRKDAQRRRRIRA